MKTLRYLVLIFITFLTLVPSSAQQRKEKRSMNKQELMAIMTKVADWQIENPSKTTQWEWHYGAFYSGLMNFYKVNLHTKYLTTMYNMGESFKWEVRKMPTNANVLALGHMYTDMYEIIPEPKILTQIRFCLDAHFDRPKNPPDVTFVGNDYWLTWWSWCDALFMAPPTFAQYAKVTGESKYLDKMDELWKITHDYLYDEEEHLYYRDDSFFEARSKNGKKVFWSRGNGWVIAGLCKVLMAMPEDYHNREFYEQLFLNMAAKIKETQTNKGYWSTSLLDHDDVGSIETSGTGFYCYALAWGINNGYLDREEYLPSVKKALTALTEAVHPSGMLGYVQSPGDSPGEVSYHDTDVYGTGAFLLAGSEIYKLADE